MPTKHLTYGGSTIARTLACPGWASLAKQMPPQTGQGSDAANEGTALHDAMEFLVNSDQTPDACAMMFFNKILITDELLETRLRPAYDAMLEILDDYDVPVDGSTMVEPFVEIIPNLAGGSIDLLALSRDRKTIILIDYKFGFMPVSPEENKQLLFYGLCADADPATAPWFEEAENLVLAIIQPANAGDEYEQYKAEKWCAPIAVLDAFESEVAAAISEAEGDNPRFNTGDHCQYCPAEVICPIKTGQAAVAAKLPAVAVETLETFLPMLGSLEKWIAAVKAMAQEQLEKGAEVKGFKLVNKRPTRVWTNKTEVEALLKKNRKLKVVDVYKQELKSPAQMEKVLAEKGLDKSLITDYISSVSSGTTIAPASDKREAVLPCAAMRAALERLPQ